ncbi:MULTISPECIES: glutathione-regulated potassium-efflux system ancillary protein KefG [unclassified Salinivibrio]|uniref:glutathione-regulated potassium-efflux system ancillary protein KefG n=1 Tax=unclassified Salinivibrio TaxID=2636825 RepID=UPI0006145D17|nr:MULTISPECIES: glutathione-regulated potassium-efflux system ancillary protein KefG [unclassified Salinivibrio]KKA44768.1 potassium transporter KefG [Salinivibrio sp. KP-1]MPS32725.1 glutathione-regulated potassium-efflux system ancillary protein KefG [Salinivibrio sp. VYel7]MPX90733.1 glutathione-regulated potassium-efflux system ancillary protein KefG [Salinivibrio sp. VYel1]MPX94115.1 glutathione-regulated potassium-efflux system ancillary protein KefG [Salinivibrio sp. VYel9]MPX96823.1 g
MPRDKAESPSLPKVLVIFAHPDPDESVANRRLIEAITPLAHVTVHDIYAAYPDFVVDVHHERALVTDADVLVFQHPLQMYSCPALLKEWIDVVLGKGFAHGQGGDALAGKTCRFVVTTGGAAEAFSQQGYNKYSMAELLQPFELTASLCRMYWIPPLVLHWARRVGDADREAFAEIYADWLADPLVQQGGEDG